MRAEARVASGASRPPPAIPKSHLSPHPAMTRSVFFALALTLPLAACGDDAPAPPPPAPEAPVAEAPPAPTAEPLPAPDGPVAEIALTPVGNEMRYEQPAFSVREGQTVTLTFTNTADMEAMHHNVVVLQPTADVNAFGQAAMSAADTDYVPAAMADQVVAHTAMSAPGETVTVEFTAPAAGTYTYVCTYPGHYISMRGTMTVVPT